MFGSEYAVIRARIWGLDARESGSSILERSVFSRGLESASVRSDYSDVQGSCVCFRGVVLGTCAKFHCCNCGNLVLTVLSQRV